MAAFVWQVVEAPPPAAPTAPAAGAALRPAARAFKLDAAGDIAVEGGRWVLLSGAEALAQSLRTRLALVRGEWFLNLDEGVPYWEVVFVKAPNLAAIRSALRERILSTPGVLELTDLRLTFRPSTRSLEVSFSVTANVGALSIAFEVP